jgi:hypothetical protein
MMSEVRNLRFAQFFHRRNPDSTFDSVCSICFETVVTAKREEELRGKELIHQCLPKKQSGKVLTFPNL